MVVAGCAPGRQIIIGGEDQAELMIAAGLARDCPRFSGGRYAAAEQPEASELPLLGYLPARMTAPPRAGDRGSKAEALTVTKTLSGSQSPSTSHMSLALPR